MLNGYAVNLAYEFPAQFGSNPFHVATLAISRSQAYSQGQESGLVCITQGRRTCRPFIFASRKIARGEPAWVSPCTLIRCRPSLAGGAAGVEFLLLHLPPDDESHELPIEEFPCSLVSDRYSVGVVVCPVMSRERMALTTIAVNRRVRSIG